MNRAVFYNSKISRIQLIRTSAGALNKNGREEIIPAQKSSLIRLSLRHTRGHRTQKNIGLRNQMTKMTELECRKQATVRWVSKGEDQVNPMCCLPHSSRLEGGERLKMETLGSE